jgi:hypothetical protein
VQNQVVTDGGGSGGGGGGVTAVVIFALGADNSENIPDEFSSLILTE